MNNKPEYEIDTCSIIVTKHFRNKYLKKWNWDMIDLRNAIKEAHHIDKVGKEKYEVYVRKNGSKKIILAYQQMENIIIVISGAEGK